jgi:23S rRNA (guanosine2251-2'-O)-methyltransferase
LTVKMTADPTFQIYECQNPDCRLRIPTDLTVKVMKTCPKCSGTLLPSGETYQNESVRKELSVRPACRFELLLDNLRSTLNVGSIFRTADGAGVAHIYCCGTTPTPEHPKISKTSLGAQEFIPWSYHRNALEVLETKLNQKFIVFSLESTTKSENLFDAVIHQPSTPALLIIGNEISGIDPELVKRSHHVYSLPMMGKKTSLNVAVAAGIALYMLMFSSKIQS